MRCVNCKRVLKRILKWAATITITSGLLLMLRVHWSVFFMATSPTIAPCPVDTGAPVTLVHEEHLAGKSEIKQFIDKTAQQNKTVLLTFVNFGFISLVHSWLCNTVDMGIHEQILVFVTDVKTKVELGRLWPRVSVINMAEEGLYGFQKYQHAGYLKLMAKRTRYLQWLLKNNMEFLLFEVDSIWFSNPLPAVIEKAKDHDMVVVHDNDFPFVPCGCFIYMKPTDRTKRLWNELTRMMNDYESQVSKLRNHDQAPFYHNDQTLLMHLTYREYCGIRVAWMPYSQFPYGLWFDMKESARKEYKPLVLHNNWVGASPAKISRAKLYNLFFWDSYKRVCDTDLVKHYTSPNFTHEMIAKITPKPKPKKLTKT